MFTMYDIKRDLVINKIHAIYYSELKKTHAFTGESHNFWEFLYVDNGHVIGHILQNNFFIDQGYGILIKPNDFHDLYGNGQDASNIVNFSFSCLSPQLEEVGNQVQKLTSFQKNILKALIQALSLPKTNLFKLNLYEILDENRFGSQQIVANLIEVFLIDFFQTNTSIQEPEQPNLLRGNQLCREAAKIISVIDSNINKKIDLDFLAEATHYTPSRIRKVIKDSFNVPIKVLVNQKKVERAKILLRESDMNISEISEFLGFSRIGYFSDVFFNITGIRPLDYKNSLRE